MRDTSAPRVRRTKRTWHGSFSFGFPFNPRFETERVSNRTRKTSQSIGRDRRPGEDGRCGTCRRRRPAAGLSVQHVVVEGTISCTCKDRPGVDDECVGTFLSSSIGTSPQSQARNDGRQAALGPSFGSTDTVATHLSLRERSRLAPRFARRSALQKRDVALRRRFVSVDSASTNTKEILQLTFVNPMGC